MLNTGIPLERNHISATTILVIKILSGIMVVIIIIQKEPIIAGKIFYCYSKFVFSFSKLVEPFINQFRNSK